MPFAFLLISTLHSYSQDTTRAQKETPQEEDGRFSWNKVSIGGNFGLSRNYVNVSPAAGYMVTKKLMIGAGGTYITLGDHTYPQWLTIYGGKVFGRYFPLAYAFAHAEVEELHGPWDPLSDHPFWINTTLVGGGYRQNIGGSFFMDMMILFNINDHLYSPYQNPIIRMGASIGL